PQRSVRPHSVHSGARSAPDLRKAEEGALMAYRDWMLPEDDQELRKQAGIEASALSRIRPEGRFRFVENVGTYRSTSRARHGALGRLSPLRAEKMRGIHPRLRQEWDDFINTYSEVVVKYGGELPMDWLVKQTPQDLVFLNILTGADVQWLIDAKRAALEDRLERQMREQKIQKVVDKLTSYEQMAVDLRIAKYENNWEDIKQILEGKDRVEQDRLHSASMALPVGLTRETVEERRKRIEEWVRANWDPTQPEPTYWQYHFQPDGADSFIGTGLQLAGKAMEGITDFFNG